VLCGQDGGYAVSGRRIGSREVREQHDGRRARDGGKEGGGRWRELERRQASRRRWWARGEYALAESGVAGRLLALLWSSVRCRGRGRADGSTPRIAQCIKAANRAQTGGRAWAKWVKCHNQPPFDRTSDAALYKDVAARAVLGPGERCEVRVHDSNLSTCRPHLVYLHGRAIKSI
jgi:hypothetical protein